MTKQVPSKHDTTRTVISILPLATFHQWLIKLVDCSTLCANLTPVSLLLFFNSCSNSNWNWYCLKKSGVFFSCVYVCVCERMTGLTFLMYVFAKKKPKHFVSYFYSSALPVQLNMYSITWLFHRFSFGRWPGGWVRLHGLDHYSS